MVKLTVDDERDSKAHNRHYDSCINIKNNSRTQLWNVDYVDEVTVVNLPDRSLIWWI